MYYLADGIYPPYRFTTVASGTATLEIRKAQSYDNGGMPGWNARTMGSSQAVFRYISSEPVLSIGVSYVTVNGNGTSIAPGCGGAGSPGTTRTQSPPTPSDCGIEVDNSTCTIDVDDACDDPIKSTEEKITNLRLEYVETFGNNNNLSEKMVIFQPYRGDGHGTFAHLFLHNAGCVYIQGGQQSETVSFSYFWGNSSNAAGCHGQASFSAGADSDTTYANNVFRDIAGTAIWTFAAPSTTHDSWTIYNNVIWNDSQTPGRLEDGIIACINSETVCTNFMVAHNTMVNLNYATGTVFSNAGSITFYNNVWYMSQGIDGRPGGISFGLPGGSKLTEDYNSFLRSGSAKPGSGAHDVTDASAPNPFVNWSEGNFNLALEHADWSNRLILTSLYATDPNGTARTTDRGAYQYVGSTIPSQVQRSSRIAGSGQVK